MGSHVSAAGEGGDSATKAVIGAPGRPTSFVLRKLRILQPRLSLMLGAGVLNQDSSGGVDGPSPSHCTQWLVPILEQSVNMVTASCMLGTVLGPLDTQGKTARAPILRPGQRLLISCPWLSIHPSRPAETWQTKGHGATYSPSLLQSD